MSKVEQNLQARAQLFKALGHPARLLILNLVQNKPRHGEELAAILRLKPATISNHLSKLASVGLILSSSPHRSALTPTLTAPSNPSDRTAARR